MLDEKSFLKEANSKALATQIVIHRLLGIRKDLAIKCMQELKRREVEDKDDFNYLLFIEDELEKSPKPELPKDNVNLLNNLFNTSLNDFIKDNKK